MRTCEDGSGRRDHIEFPALDGHWPGQVRDAVTACVANQLHETVIWGEFTMCYGARSHHHVPPVCPIALVTLFLEFLFVALGIHVFWCLRRRVNSYGPCPVSLNRAI